MICPNEILLEKEIDHLRTVFININDYPTRVVNNFVNNKLQKPNISNNATNNKIEANINETKEEQIQLLLPFSRKQGTKISLRMRKKIEKVPSS